MPDRQNLPSMFVGSSTEGVRVAQELQAELEHDAECTLWYQGVFGLTTGGLESLLGTVGKFDFATLVLTPDDVTTKRGKAGNSPRDNVLFEFGLFLGALGRDRTFMLHCRDDELELPSDLAGVIPATYRRRADGNLRAALGPPATAIRNAMESAPPRNWQARAMEGTVNQSHVLVQRLVPGSNAVIAPARETVAQIAARVDPVSAVVSIWKPIPGVSQYMGAEVGGVAPSSVSNLTVVNAFDVIYLNVNAPAMYRTEGGPTLSENRVVMSPVRVYGTAELNGRLAPQGTAILALLGSTVCSTAEVSSNGTYVMDIDSAASVAGCATDGATVSFTVGGVRASQTVTWRSGYFAQVNLTARSIS